MAADRAEHRTAVAVRVVVDRAIAAVLAMAVDCRAAARMAAVEADCLKAAHTVVVVVHSAVAATFPLAYAIEFSVVSG